MQSGDARLHRGLSQMHEYYIVDNTPYPYPIGSYPFESLSLTMAASLSLEFNSKYKVQGIRLIFLNLTLLLVYAVVIGVIICRTRRVQAELLLTAPDYNLNCLTKRPSELTQQPREPID